MFTARIQSVPTGLVRTFEIAGPEWDDLVAGFSDQLIEQSHAYNAARWGADRLRHIRIERDGQIIGGALAVVLTEPVFGRGAAAIKFGPLWHRKGRPADIADYTDVLHATRRHWVDEARLHVTITPPPMAPEEVMGGLARAGFSPGRQLTHPRRYLVALDPDAQAQRASLSQKWRSHLRKAENHDFHIEFVPGQTGLDRFMPIYRAMSERKGFDDASGIGAMPVLMDSRQPELRPDVALLSHRGKEIAGAIVAAGGDIAYYLFGATTDDALPLRAGYALQFWIATQLARRGNHWYDLGGDGGNAGLTQFKKGFVGKTGVMPDIVADHSLCTDPVSRLAGYGLEQVHAWRERRHLRANA